MSPESRTLLHGLLSNQLDAYARDRASPNLLAVTYHPDKTLPEGRAAISARLDTLEAAVRQAAAELHDLP